jgi:asparagine synthetase A
MYSKVTAEAISRPNQGVETFLEGSEQGVEVSILRPARTTLDILR